MEEKKAEEPKKEAIKVKEESKESELDKLKRWYKEELLRRDKIIEDLKKKNLLLMKASLKTSERLAEIQDMKKDEKSEDIEKKAKDKIKIRDN